MIMKRTIIMVIVVVALLIGLAIPLTTHGAEQSDSHITAADAVAIHAVVQLQLDALAEDDAVVAFELATPAKRLQIGTPDNFMRLIKENYNPIYRHSRAIFSSPQLVNGNALQIVRLTDRNSQVWLAIFWMQRHEGSWRIDGCHLLETTSISI